jgi:Tfp pilus assembly protein PilF
LAKAKTDLQAATFDTNSGVRLLHAGDIDTAIAQFQAAIKLAETYAPAHYQLALALQRKGSAAAAQAEFRRAGQLDPRLKPPQP